MPKQAKGLKPGAKLPPFSLPDTAGQEHHHSEFLGKPLLLYFMRGTW